MEEIIGTVPGKCRKKREKTKLPLKNNPETSWYMKIETHPTYNGVHLTDKLNAQDVVEQSLTFYQHLYNITQTNYTVPKVNS